MFLSLSGQSKSRFTLLVAQCIRFFAYIWLIYLLEKHNVLDFSHICGSFILLEAQCIRFFAYIWLINLTVGTMYSFFRIHFAHIPNWKHNVFVFSHTFCSFTLLGHNVGFSFTFSRLISAVRSGRLVGVFACHQ